MPVSVWIPGYLRQYTGGVARADLSPAPATVGAALGGLEAPVHDGDEISIIPAVSGGGRVPPRGFPGLIEVCFSRTRIRPAVVKNIG